jgi:hypothetical protein
MAFTLSNVTFKTSSAFLNKCDHELERASVLYDNEFAVNPYSKLVLTNKYGEMLLRQLIDEEEGEYMYYVVVFDTHECNTGSYSFIGYSHTHFDSNLKFILDNYFNDDNEAPTNDGYVGLGDDDDCYATIYSEYKGTEPEMADELDYDLIGWEQFVAKNPPQSSDEEFVYTEEEGCHLYRFTNDCSIIPSLDCINSNYSKKYEIVLSAYGIPIQTYGGQYISRLKKDNGKHRYYLTNVTSELETDDICYTQSKMFYVFKSQYVGKNLEDVLKQFVYVPQNWF